MQLATAGMVEFPSTMFGCVKHANEKGPPAAAPPPTQAAECAANYTRSLIVGGELERAGVDTVRSRRCERNRSADPENHASRRAVGSEVDRRWRVRRESERSRTGQVEPRAGDGDGRVVGADELVARRRRGARAADVAAAARERTCLIHADDLARPGARAGED